MMNHRKMPNWLHITPLLSAILLLAAAPQQAEARDYPFKRYESRHFVVHSNASAKKTRKIVEEFELFRAAVLQVSAWRIPETAPKADVLIVRNRREFADVSPEPQLSYVGMAHGGRHLVVINEGNFNLWIREDIKHHYTHSLFNQMSFPYPVWYQEGFSRLVSMIQFRKKNTAFTIGEFPGGCRRRSGVSLEDEDINRLISGEWENEKLRQGPACERYLQSAMLAHYVTLGEDFANYAKLNRYFALMNSGQPSLPAFTQAFGMDPNQLFAARVDSYGERLFVVVVDFEMDKIFLDIEESDSDTAVVQALMAEIRSLEVQFRTQDHLKELIETRRQRFASAP